MEKNHKLEVIKLSDPNYLRVLENCIQVSSSFLIYMTGDVRCGVTAVPRNAGMASRTVTVFDVKSTRTFVIASVRQPMSAGGRR